MQASATSSSSGSCLSELKKSIDAMESTVFAHEEGKIMRLDDGEIPDTEGCGSVSKDVVYMVPALGADKQSSGENWRIARVSFRWRTANS